MAKIELNKPFTMELDDVRQGLEKLANNLNQEHGMKYEWEGEYKAVFSHKTAKGYVEIRGNELVLSLKLGMMYSAMAPVVKKRIQEMADQYIS